MIIDGPQNHIRQAVGIDQITFQIQSMESRQNQMDDKIKLLEQKNREYQQTNSSLWQELCKSREREQSLEKLFILAFTCLASANGYAMGAPREILNQQYGTGNNQSTAANNSAEK